MNNALITILSLSASGSLLALTLFVLSANRKLPASILSTTLCENKKELEERLISIMKYKKKSTWVAALTLVLTLFLAGCAATLGVANSTSISRSTGTPTSPEAAPAVNSATSSNTPAPSEQLKSILAKNTANEIVFFQSFTTGDNQNAAFAIVAGGEVWYITATGAEKLKSNIAYSLDNQSDAPVIWTVDGVTLFKCEEVPGGSSSMSHAWYVKDGRAVELPYTGMLLSYIGNGQFTTIGDAFDRNFTDGVGTGHTYKPYDLYWTPDGLKEYGGLKITRQQLLKAKGAQAIMDAITQSGYAIDDIYYRANNIININYHSGDKQNGDFYYVTLVYKNNVVTLQLAGIGAGDAEIESLTESHLSDISYGGIYQAALFSHIATYPDEFPHQ